MYEYEIRKGIFFKAGPALLMAVLIWLALSGLRPVTALAYSGGDGSSGDPYQISTISDLEQVRADTAAGVVYWYRLENDIDLSGVTNWTPIGDDSKHFKGHFDGNNHVIRNMSISLFGYIDSAAGIKDLGLENMDINLDAGGYVGGLAGISHGTISNCSVAGRVYTGPVLGTGINIGGLVGFNGGTISTSHTTVNVSGNAIVGGLVGTNNGTNYNGSISNSYATGRVSATQYVDGTSAVGGLVGVNYGGSISNSYATGSVSGDGKGAGGLAGGNNGSISNSYATGNVSAGGDGAGGLAGGNSGSINNCYATGSVNGAGVGIGALVGGNDTGGNISSSYAITAEHQLVGYNQGNIDTESSLKTSAQMKIQATFVGWDFGSVWAIKEGLGYPYLQNVTVGPGVAETDPADGATNVSPDKTITVTFSESIQAGADIGNITFNNTVADYVYSVNGSVLTIDPTTDLDSSAYTVTIPATAVEGLQAIPMAADYSFSFTTTVPVANISSTEPTTLTEAAANNGSLASGEIVITIANGTLADPLVKADVAAANLPAGLDYTVTRDSDTQLTVTITGNAANHTNADDVSNLTFTIAQSKVTGAESDLTTSNISIDFNDPAATAPDITVTPLPIAFGDVPAGSFANQIVTVKNDGNADLNIGLITNPAAPFSIVEDNVSNQTLAPGVSATMTVRFAPGAAGPYNDSFDIPSDDPDENPVTVNLSGNGIVAPDLTGSFTMLKSYARGRAVMAKVLIQNTGNAASGSFKIAFYISDDASFDPGADQFLWSRNVLGIGAGKNTTTGFFYKFRNSVSGKYLLAVIDSTNKVAESNENNNTAAGQIP